MAKIIDTFPPEVRTYVYVRKLKFPQFILPFALAFKLPKEVDILSAEGKVKLDALFSNVETLVANFGSSCVCSFEISVERENEQLANSNLLEKLYETLAIISEGLVSLTLQGLIFGNTKVFNDQPDLKFPNLERMSLHYFSTIQPSHEHDTFWIDKCPMLKKVHVQGIKPLVSRDLFWPLPVQLINSLAIVHSSETNLFEKLSNDIFWPLSHLELDSSCFGLIDSPEACARVATILNRFAKTLETLKLKFTERYVPLEFQIIIQFPHFPRLRSLNIDLANNYRIYQFILKSTSFPALESISLTSDLVIMTPDHNIFPSVVSLTLNIKPGVICPEDTKDYMENLQRLFPKLCKISFGDLISERSFWAQIIKPNYTIVRMLEGLIYSEGGNRIEFLNTMHDYLGLALGWARLQKTRRLILENVPRDDVVEQILLDALQRIINTNNFDVVEDKKDERSHVTRLIFQEKKPRDIMTNFEKLKKLKIKVTKEAKRIISSSDGYRVHQVNIQPLFELSKLNLELMTQNCPTLKEIYFSKFYVKTNSESQPTGLEKISFKFPNLIFKLI